MHHSVGLTKLLEKNNPFSVSIEAFIEFLKGDGEPVSLSTRHQAMLDYSKKLTQNPGQMATEDGQKLKEAGLTDREIHDLCAIVSYFAFVNRIADGLGVDLESFHQA